jgi:hypothetical protein
MRRNLTSSLVTGITMVMALTGLGLAAPATARAEYRNEKQLKLEPGGRFVVDSGTGSVRITGTAGSGARVVVTSNRDDLERLFELNFQESPGQVEVTLRRRYSFERSNNLRVRFEVEVPAETSVDVKTGGGSVEIAQLRRDANLNTSGGSIKVSDLEAKLEAHTSGGSISLRHVTGSAHVDTSGGGIEGDNLGASLDARTSGGSIRLEGVEGDLLAHTSGGSIHIDNAGGRVEAKTSGGSVEVSFTQGNGRGGDVETSGGGVRVALDPSVNLNLEASASSGSISSDLPIQMSGRISTSHINGTIGSGGELLRLHSDGGPIRIAAR